MDGKITFQSNVDSERLVSFAMVFYLLLMVVFMIEEMLKDKVK